MGEKTAGLPGNKAARLFYYSHPTLNQQGPAAEVGQLYRGAREGPRVMETPASVGATRQDPRS